MSRPPRLSRDRYLGERTAAFTACIQGRVRHFIYAADVAPHVDFLRRACDKAQCIIPIYCFMPDHLHVMFKGLDDDSNSLAAMSHFKLLSGLNLDHFGGPRWQKSFYDHVMRYGSDWRAHARYIAMNPVRAGLVESPFDYPLLGTIGSDLQEVILPTTGGR